jgi:predicted methyltransferase
MDVQLPVEATGVGARRVLNPGGNMFSRIASFIRRLGVGIGVVTLAFAANGGLQAQTAVDYAAIIASPDRSDADRQTDKRRDPVKLLAFTGVRPGMKVLDMGAGGGYSTELIARSVGATGKVFGQDSEPRERFQARAKAAAMSNVTYLIRPFDDPAPADLNDLDLVTYFFAYHDTAFANVDRARQNQKLFAALKPGGLLVIADHSARAGDGVSVAKSLHRIEESVVRQELEAAGFKLAGEADFLRHPEDARDVIVFRSPVPVDEFVLKFQKPQAR